jgi:hypothetical protein
MLDAEKDSDSNQIARSSSSCKGIISNAVMLVASKSTGQAIP